MDSNVPMFGDSLSCKKPFLNSKRLFIICAKREPALWRSQLAEHEAAQKVVVNTIYWVHPMLSNECELSSNSGGFQLCDFGPTT